MRAAPHLLELQQGFADALRGRGDAVSAWVDGAGLDPAARLRIYQHAAAATLTAALRDSYPAVCAMVGDPFFDALAARYRRQHPSICGNLQHFGENLADFIATMPEAQNLPYLPDLARLEWRRQSAALAADAVAVDAVGSAAAIRLLGARIDALGSPMTPFASLTRASVLYVAAGFLPIIGWGVVLPAALLLSLGSGVAALGRAKPQARPVQPLPTPVRDALETAA